MHEHFLCAFASKKKVFGKLPVTIFQLTRPDQMLRHIFYLGEVSPGQLRHRGVKSYLYNL